MLAVPIVAAAGSLLIWLSVRANARFRGEERLPMQWSFSGTVNWTAPRALALSLTPALAIAILTVSAVMMALSEPRPGQEGLEAPILLLVAGGFVAVHMLHLWMIGKSLSKDGR